MSTNRSLNKLEFKAHMSIHDKVVVSDDAQKLESSYTRDRFGKNQAIPNEKGVVHVRRIKKDLLVFALLSSMASFLLNPVLVTAQNTFAAKPSIYLTAKSCVVVDVKGGTILYSKQPNLKLPGASTAKVMTALLVLEHLPMKQKVTISRNAAGQVPSKAGLTSGTEYSVEDLLKAVLVASSNDAAVALAEAVAGSEKKFAYQMNLKARALGINDTFFVNATGLPDETFKQYTTAYDLARLMRVAVKDKRIDKILGITETSIEGSDGKAIRIRAHNKMLWKIPRIVKGKTGWTRVSRHTFVGTNYSADKSITFALLSSKKLWTDIERLALEFIPDR